MSYFFTILSPTDKSLFSHTFGTSKGGGDGQPHFNFRTFSSAAIANLASSTTPTTTTAAGSMNSAAAGTTTSQYMNQFLVHASLDVVEEVQWLNNAMYLKTIDTYPPTNAHISCWLTGTNVRFLLLHQPNVPSSGAASGTTSVTAGSVTGIGAGGNAMVGATGRGGMNPGSQQMEEAVRGFMTEVFESWVKCLMNPFYEIGMEVTSPVFKTRVVNAGRKWL